MSFAGDMSSQDQVVDPLGQLIGYHLRRAFGAFAADFSASMEGTGMRQVLVGILAVISDRPGIHQGMVGAALGIKRANMVALINELLGAGLVARTVDPGDRRAHSLILTAAGSTMLSECLERIRRHEERMLADFTAEDKARLLELLGRIERRPGSPASDTQAG